MRLLRHSLAGSEMILFLAVYRLQHSHAGKADRPALLGSFDQAVHCRLPRFLLVLGFGSLVMYWPASRNVLAILPFGSFTGSSKVSSHDIRNSTQQSRYSSVDLAIGSGRNSLWPS